MNDFEKKTEQLIQLADGEAPVVKAESLPVDDVQPVKKGGGGVLVKILLAIVGVILVLALALVGTGCGLVSCVTADTMPEAPASVEIDMTEFALGAVTEIIKENTISVDEDFVNSLLVKVVDTVNASTDLIQINELFCDIENGAGIVYARIYVGTINVKGFDIKIDRVVPVQAGFNVDFDEETKDVIAKIGEINCGKITIPDAVIDTVLAQIELPQDVTVDADGNIRYNTATLDAMIDQAMTDAISSSVEGSLGGLLSNFATNLINVELTDAQIIDNEIVISGSVF